MFTDKNIVYSNPGKYLKYKNQIGFQFELQDGIEEFDIIYDLDVVGNTVYYNRGTLAQRLNKSWKYGDYKREIIKKRYSNDDQIAIILNKNDSEEDLNRYNYMMQWREFASELSHKIINYTNEKLL